MSPAARAPSNEPTPGGPLRAFGSRTVTVVGALLVLELLLKYVGGYGWMAVNERSERYGWRMLPNQDARSRDLSVVEHINDMGFRDRDWDPPRRGEDGAWLRDESLFRVAMLGNSMTYGTSVAIEQVFSRVLEDLLQEELQRRGSERRALVMNFALQGYCLEQNARVYEDVVRPYVPDLVIVQPMQPSVDDSDYDLRTLVMRTAIYDMLLRHVIDRWMPRVPRSPEERRAMQRWLAIEDSLKQRPFARENRTFFETAGQRLDGVLRAVVEDGGRMVIVTLPRWRKHFDPRVKNADGYFRYWVSQRQPYVVEARPWPEFEELMRPVVEEIRAKGLPAGTTFDLSTATWTDEQGRERLGTDLETAEQSLHLLDDMGHLTARGHAVVARSIRDAIVEAGLLD
jgi:hypothetical protein